MAREHLASKILEGSRQNYFLIAFGIGLLVIAVLKWLLRDDAVMGGFTVAVICIVIMRTFIYFEKRIRLPESYPRLGDEAYYLGLLYTLLSLCAALVMLFLVESDEGVTLEQRTNEIIGSFGIALLTTIFGIVFRQQLQNLVSNTGGPDDEFLTESFPPRPGASASEEAHRRAAINLEEFAVELRRQMQDSIYAFTSFQHQTRQQAYGLQQQLEESLQTYADGLKNAAQTHLDETKEFYNNVRESMAVAVSQAEFQQTEVKVVLEAFNSAMSNIVARVHQLGDTTDAVTEQLNKFNTQLKLSSDSIDSATTTFERRLTDVTNLINDQNYLAKTNIEQFQDILDKATMFRQGLVNLNQGANEAVTELAKIPENLKELTTIAETLATFGTVEAELKRLAEQVQQLIGQFAENVRSAGHQQNSIALTNTKLKALAESIDSGLAAQNQWTAVIQGLVDILGKADDYTANVKDSSEAIDQTNKELSLLNATMRNEGLELANAMQEAFTKIERAHYTAPPKRGFLARLFGRS